MRQKAKTEGVKCPKCGAGFTGHSAVEKNSKTGEYSVHKGPVEPLVGDHSLCHKCGLFLVFEEASVREMTPEEIVDMPSDDRRLMAEIRDGLSKISKERGKGRLDAVDKYMDDEALMTHALARRVLFQIVKEKSLTPVQVGEMAGWIVLEVHNMMLDRAPKRAPGFLGFIEDLLKACRMKV